MTDNKTLFVLQIFALLAVIAFLGDNITGYFAKTVSYEDICTSDSDCASGKVCCIIEEGLGLCDYEQNCQSVTFLCKSNDDCEEGTVCCISEGMDYGICNYEDRCMSIEFFAEYVTKTKPAPLNKTKIIVGIAVILVLVLVGLWLLKKKK